MTNKAAHSSKASADYVVGQVSGSLFQRSCAASGSLTALFSTDTPAPALRFQPPPKPVEQSKEPEAQQKGRPEAKCRAAQKKNKRPKQRSAAEQKLESRESSLQEAEEQGPSTAKKRKRSESGRESDAEHWVMRRQRLKASREEEQVKRSRTVFVGNLPISCTKKNLRSIFRDKGSIESIRFRSVVREDPNMTRKVATIRRQVHPKKESMNAYVVFKDEEGAARALERNGMEMEKDFHIRVDRETKLSSHDHRRSVFVGNLSFEIKEVAFRRHFEECGAVEAVRLVRDKNSGMGKGFGYVLFQNVDSVQLALELDGSKLEGRSVRVKRSVEKEKKTLNSKGSAPNFRKGPGSGQKMGAGHGGFKSPKKLTKSSSSFQGEMVDLKKKTKKKGLKKKTKQSKVSS